MSNNIKEISILYVEDELDVRETFTRLLNKWAKEVYVASDGQQGLEYYERYHPDIIISDIRMPNKNGIEMVREIRESNQEVPIIFTTAHGESSYLYESIELHVSSYLLKPVSKNTLKERLSSSAKSILFEKKKNMHNKMMQNVIDMNNNLVFVTNTKKLSFINNTTVDFFKIECSEEFCKKTRCISDLFVEKEGHLHHKLIQSDESFYDLLQRTEESKRVAVLYDFNTQESKIFFISGSKVFDEHDNDLYIYSLTDITEMSCEKVEFEYKAYNDKLTNVYNRAKIDEVIDYNIRLSQRYKNNFCLIVIDIDHFKNFNDTYGHQIGDEVLVLFAKTINNAIRKTDIFARWGGEEFVVVLPESKIEDAINLAKYLRKIVEKIEHKVSQNVTASFGVTQYCEGDSATGLFKRADESLYVAKEKGRNRVEFII